MKIYHKAGMENIAPIIFFVVTLLLAGAVVIARNTSSGSPANANAEQNTQQADAQVVMLGLGANGDYTPQLINVEYGKPVVLRNDGTLAGCGLYPSQPELGIRGNFAKDKEISFLPAKKGSFIMSCSMGMMKATINVA